MTSTVKWFKCSPCGPPAGTREALARLEALASLAELEELVRMRKVVERMRAGPLASALRLDPQRWGRLPPSARRRRGPRPLTKVQAEAWRTSSKGRAPDRR